MALIASGMTSAEINVGDSLGSIRTFSVTPCVEVGDVWTVPGVHSRSPGRAIN